MRADDSNIPANDDKKQGGNATTPRRPNDYVVAPVYVHDSTSTVAAHFMSWFVTLGPEHIQDVSECGMQQGGFVDEVEHFKYQCENDVDSDDNGDGYWPLEENGPWIYSDVSAEDVAKVVYDHTRGWSAEEFGAYGYTVEERAALDAAIAQVLANAEKLGLPRRK